MAREGGSFFSFFAPKSQMIELHLVSVSDPGTSNGGEVWSPKDDSPRPGREWRALLRALQHRL